jgi:phospholipid/cholesterol/gamma-HCH transport system substrate-binding protein
MKRRNEVLVGLLTLIAILIGVLGSVWIARGGLSSGYRVYAKFPWSAGLKLGQPVLLGGVTMGFVEDVDLREDGTVLTTLNITSNKRIPRTVVASVESNGVFGDKVVSLRGVPSNTAFSKGDTLPVGSAGPGLDNLINQASPVLARFDTMAANLSDVIKTIQVKVVREGGAEDLRKTLASMSRLADQLSAVVDTQSHNLTITLAAVRKGVNVIDSAMIDSTIRGIRSTTNNVAQLTKDLQGTTVRLNGILAKVDSGPGTISMMLNDKDLYVDLRRLSMRLDSLTSDFKQNPKKYIKLSIF